MYRIPQIEQGSLAGVLRVVHTREGRCAFATSSPCRAGAISGVQSSLQSLFQTLAYAIGIAVHRAEDFTWLMAGSSAVVAMAAATFTAFVLSADGDAKPHATGFDVVPSDDGDNS